MAKQPPTWLDKLFLEHKLQEFYKDDSVQINKFEVKPATNAGDNYASDIYRACIELIRSNVPTDLSVVIKVVMLGRADEFKLRVFRLEAEMLTNTMPILNELASKFSSPFSAKCLYYGLEPTALMILEDLCTDGFKLPYRFNGLDKDHSLLVVEKLAKFHACSLSALEQNPLLYQNNQYSFWNNINKDILEDVILFGIRTLAKEILTWENFPKMYHDKVKNIEGTVIEKTYQLHLKQEKGLNVLTHGDVWTNNLMFQYNNNEVVDLKFVDFQYSTLQCPSIDLIHFIFSSTTEKVLEHHLELLLKTYHRCFETCLDKLQLNSKVRFSLDDLQRQFKKNLLFGLVAAAAVFPFTIAPPDDLLNIAEMLKDPDSYKNDAVFKSTRYVKFMQSVLIYFEKNDVFKYISLFKPD